MPYRPVRSASLAGLPFAEGPVKLHQRIERIYALPSPPLHRTQIDVLLALAFHANSKEQCWPGLRLLSAETRMAIRSVRRAIKELVSMGIVALAKGNAHRSNRYVLILPGCPKGVSLARTLRVPSAHRTVHEQLETPWLSPLESNVRRFPLRFPSR